MAGGGPELSGSGPHDTPAAPVLTWGVTTVNGDDYALATYDMNEGVRSLRATEYVTSLGAVGAGRHNLSLDADATVQAPTTVNALEFRRSPVTPTVPINLTGENP